MNILDPSLNAKFVLELSLLIGGIKGQGCLEMDSESNELMNTNINETETLIQKNKLNCIKYKPYKIIKIPTVAQMWSVEFL